MFIELHLLQSFAPSNLNRDDNNMPKDCVFGGVRRARVSSQSWKYAIRKSELFRECVLGHTAIRTSTLINEIKKRLPNQSVNPESLDTIVTAFVKAYAGKLAKQKKSGTEDGSADKEKQTAVLLYLEEQKIDRMAGMLKDEWAKLTASLPQSLSTQQDESEEDEEGDEESATKANKPDAQFKKVITGIIKSLGKAYSNSETHSLITTSSEIALFGMMLAAKGNNQKIEAACQVAHAISTHRVDMEMDFFTAMDDKLPAGAQGAGLIGQTDYNASCYYRYTRLDWQLLLDNLNGDAAVARSAVKGFLLAFAQVVPSGKQKPFSALNEPDFAFAVVRNRGMGWSLANAFEEPVGRSDNGGYLKSSVEELEGYYKWIKQAYDHPQKTTIEAEGELVFARPKLSVGTQSVEKNIYDWAEKATRKLTGLPEPKE